MRGLLLGSAAGGGFPQWNCGCAGCTAVRERRPGFLPRTEDSLAVSADGARFVLVNASPSVLAQIAATPLLWPRGPRHSPIAAVVLTNGDLDHVLGLFALRESQPLAVYATPAVQRGLEASVFLRTLRRFEGHLALRGLELGVDTPLADAAGTALGVSVRAFPLPGKLPVHLVGQAEPDVGDNIGLLLSRGDAVDGKRIAYAAACAHYEPETLPPSDIALLDGTFFREDELVRAGLSKAVAKDMAHEPVSVSLRSLHGRAGRKIYTHINNTNPLLDPGSDERRIVLGAGFEIGFDGMELVP